MDKKAFFKLTYGLYLITSHHSGHDSGCIANTFTQVTSSPARVSIALNKDNYTTELIKESKVFNCGVLLDEVSMDTIRHFGFQSGRDVDKFKDIAYQTDENGVKQIKDGLSATFSCKVIDIIDAGTHILFIGEVNSCEVVSDKEVLTYTNYHNKKKGSTPKAAPSYIEETTKTGWRCTVCGFILEQEELPEDYICPICKQPASVFEKII